VIERAPDSSEECQEIPIFSNVSAEKLDLSETSEEGEQAIVNSGDSGKGINRCHNHSTTEEDDASKSSEPAKSPSGTIEKEIFCGSATGVLLVNGLENGSSKCIRYENSLITPNEFQRRGGKQKCRKWKQSIKLANGRPIEQFIRDLERSEELVGGDGGEEEGAGRSRVYGRKSKKQNQVEMIDTNPYTMPGVAVESANEQVIQNVNGQLDIQSERVESDAISAPPGVLQSSEENEATTASKGNEIAGDGFLSERRLIANLEKRIVELEVRLCEQIEVNETLNSRVLRLEQRFEPLQVILPPTQPLSRPSYTAPQPSGPPKRSPNMIHEEQRAFKKPNTCGRQAGNSVQLECYDETRQQRWCHSKPLPDHQGPKLPVRGKGSALCKPAKDAVPYVGKRKLWGTRQAETEESVKEKVSSLLESKLDGEGEEVDFRVRKVEIEHNGRKKWWFWVEGEERFLKVLDACENSQYWKFEAVPFLGEATMRVLPRRVEGVR
jgi:hypothetical protein